MSIVDQREVTLLLGVVVEKRKSRHRWGGDVWKPVAVFPHAEEGVVWREMKSEEDVTRYHAATLPLTLHRKETEALQLNLSLTEPEIYVVLQEAESLADEFPYVPQLVTASPYHAQDFSDVGDPIVEKVPMPEAVMAFIEAFVVRHHEDEVFVKRKRDKLRIEDEKFGKTPIFTPHTKH